MTRTTLVQAIALALAGLACASHAADIVLTPPAAGGVAVTNAAGSLTRWRVDEGGMVTIPGALRIDPAGPSPLIVLGSEANTVTAGTIGATIGGGGASGNLFLIGGLNYPCPESSCENRVTQPGGTIGGGVGNRAGPFTPSPADLGAATVAGGLGNVASGGFSFVGGGWTHNATGDYATIAGGRSNSALGGASFVGGGVGNSATGSASVIGGGETNSTVGFSSVVPGGRDNVANGNYSFAGGFRARAMGDNAFAWADFNAQFFDVAANEFAARATGGVRFVTAVDGATGVPTRTFALGANGRMTLPDDFAIYRGANPFAHMTGTRNAFLGLSSGAATATGFENAALGFEALAANTDGAGNTAVGYKAMAANTTAFNSTAVGAQALASATGGGNVALGSFAGFNITTGGSNIMVGHAGDAADNATTRIGGSQTRAFIAGIRGVTTGQANAIAVFVDSNGQLGTASSSREVKQDIADMGEASEALMRLRPVTFRYKAHVVAGQDAPQYGLIAEEVAEVAPELVARSADGRIETVSYQFLAPMLVNEVQLQRRVIAEQAARIDALAGELAAIRQAIGLR